MLADDSRQVLARWNTTHWEFPRNTQLHELVEAQVERAPDAVALVAGDRTATYRHLDSRANHLAHELRRLGVGPDVLVAICVEAGIDFVVAALGILKAGGAYLPIDPTHPRGRSAFVLEDARARVIVTRAAVRARLPEHGCTEVNLDVLAPVAGDTPAPRVRAGSSEHLAYVLYTSGSTGQPKGVMVPHRAVVNYVTWMTRTFPLTASDTFIQRTPFGFDLSVWEIFLPLLLGSRSIVEPRPSGRLDPAGLIATISSHGVTVLQVVPTELRVLVEQPDLERCSTLRHVFCGGEALPMDVARRLVGRLDVQLHNLYGPTETCICSASHTLGPETPPTPTMVVGRPIANTQIHILDDAQQPVPVGAPGEIYIGGEGLARGYLRRDALTAERFVVNPVNGTSRIYRTGDRGRWRSDGTIEFLGRTDHQVKIRGFRIELGEIESALASHPAVRAAIVIAREDEPGDLRLAAYYVPNEGMTPARHDLVRHLREQVPDHMIPATFTALTALPLTANAKVDRRALPAPATVRPELETPFVAPRDATEQRLAEIWALVLRIDSVGITDNFFDLGGHSLLATSLVARINQAFELNVPLREFFEAPTIEALGVWIAARYDKGGASAVPHTHTSAGQPPSSSFIEIEPGPPAASMSLSFAQARMWFLEQLDPGNTAYNMPQALEINGPLDPGALERALGEIQRRHTVLRTTIPVVLGEPRQVIGAAGHFRLRTMDLGALPPANRDGAVIRHARDEATRPFDLQSDPPMRATLLRLDSAAHVLLLTFHHIGADGWSLGILWRELRLLYAAFLTGAGSPLAELRIQYADFAIWQREWLQGPVLERQLAYWRSNLEDLPPLELPTDRPRPPRPSYLGARQVFTLEASLVGQLRQLARAHRATLFMTLLGAFQLVLSRYSGQTDFAIGAPIANRMRPELENLIGFFANTLVLRGTLTEVVTFGDLLAHVRRTALEAYDHQDLPFEHLVADLQPARDLSRNPFVQVFFAMQNASDESPALEGLVVRRLALDTLRARLDLELHLRPAGDRFDGTVVYSSDLFDAATIERFVAHFQTLLKRLVVAGDAPLATVSLLTETERHQLLVTWNDTHVSFPRNRQVHELFDEQASRTPDAVAVVTDEETLTYGELGRAANRLAHLLRGHGVGPDVPVGLCLDRGRDLIVATLAVLKAGGAYLPLDPAYPSARLAFMLQDAQAPVVLTHSRWRNRISEAGATIVELDGDAPSIAASPAETPPYAGSSDNLAYIMYTSGSTGQPKGVMVPHRAIVRLVRNTNYVTLGAEDAVAHVSNVAFDAATFEIWGALLNGARLVVIDQDTLLVADRLAESLGRHRITAIFLTASVFNLLVRDSPTCLATVQNVMFGGEAADAASVRRILAGGKPPRLLNMYGPTEATTFSTGFEVTDCGPEMTTIPIGRPLANTQIYVLDAAMQPVPVGVAGDMYIGGDGLARGYLRRPELTAQCFVAHPFDPGPAARLYRTGDRARWRQDGSLEFLGRTDEQIKIRGRRIELGEIESALAAHPDVSGGVVVVRRDEKGDPRLVGYVVAKPGSVINSRLLRQTLRATLPEFMVPLEIIPLPALPLTPNGKVDKQALPASSPAPLVPAPAETALTKSEERLIPLWKEVLGLRHVDVRDDFFELGGHSLLAVELFSRIEAEFGCALPLATLFSHGTIRDLAGILDSKTQREAWTPLVSIRPHGSRKPLFLVHGLVGEVLSFKALAAHLPADQPVYGLQGAVPGADEQMPFELQDIARLYRDIVMSVDPEGPYLVGGYSAGGVLAWELAHQLAEHGKPVSLVLLIDAGLPHMFHGNGRGQRHSPLSLLQQICYWAIDDALKTSPNDLWQRAKSRGRRLSRTLARRLPAFLGRPQEEDVRDVLGMWRMPDTYREYLAVRWESFRKYQPPPYSGHVALIRTRTGRLLGPPSSVLINAWRALARGRFRVIRLAASHDNILAEPRVRDLAHEVESCLAEARAGDTGRTQ